MSREALIQRIIDVLQADDRVRAAWLGGSLGRGAGDRYSDVDLVAIVAEDNRAGFVAEWDGIVAAIAPVVLASRLSFVSSTVFNQVTADWLRFDVSVITPAGVDRYTASAVRPLFDKDDLYSRLRRMSKRTGTPWPDALESALRAHLDSQLGLKLPDLSLGDQRPGQAMTRTAMIAVPPARGHLNR